MEHNEFINNALTVKVSYPLKQGLKPRVVFNYPIRYHDRLK